MSIPDLVPIAFPALLIVAVAVWFVSRDRSDRDAVLDLREVPVVRLAEMRPAGAVMSAVRPSSSATCGRLVEPRATGSLGARLRFVEPFQSGAVERVTAPRRSSPRRTQPLVAVTRVQAS